MEMDGLDVEPYEVGTGTATSDYYLVLGHAGRRITGRLEYNAELFIHGTAQQMASDWQVGDSALRTLLWNSVEERPLPSETNGCCRDSNITKGCARRACVKGLTSMQSDACGVLRPLITLCRQSCKSMQRATALCC